MKPLIPFLVGFALAAAAGAIAQPGSFHSAREAVVTFSPPPAQPALYSFTDVYRLTVAGAIAGQPLVESVSEAPLRVAALGAGTEPRFTIAKVRPPDKWLLLLAGLALAGWVAHRRLAHSI